MMIGFSKTTVMVVVGAYPITMRFPSSQGNAKIGVFFQRLQDQIRRAVVSEEQSTSGIISEVTSGQFPLRFDSDFRLEPMDISSSIDT